MIFCFFLLPGAARPAAHFSWYPSRRRFRSRLVGAALVGLL